MRPTVRERPPMTALYWLGGLTAALLFAYLAYALFNPEKF
ncbi:K+-transporting ATPase, F subunit [Bordetella pertussis H973]|uniref:K+-transporting ATPase, F subunit n=7 Tax=Bordetella TaxID=517 RepID=A0A158M4C6_9BORD|nr:K+-transporting ATPase, F subunit [Bordetella holmesii ATCC 51541]AIT24900.1 K+-transporting ATPase, F subunit [Bordetella holmesii 44057]ETA64703.1 K+-transporting ATPase, F subunit [Bordetella pertussis CHLA-11]ETH00192.1 K+-transporting ATPase, F subunit [Bordetella pertussis 2250905]ETH03162.1 K+-transporting ATPase, F subunit [Bordetella pertussis 2356847]ETH08620.1 K+-transporting ATPase, F subunit [Bordetella pertussis 2371640]ETH11311.1 K+-transporting ATPase, F subunit [Bordetella